MGMSDPKAFIVYSSPAGTTRHVARVIENTLKDRGYKCGVTDLGNKDDCLNLNSKVKDLATDHCLWVGTPVYTGHAVPQVTRFISGLPESTGSCAVPFVTWGGVSSGLALYEMGRGLSEKGYTVLGAAKVLAVHSLMWQFKSPLGEGHPDAEDDSMIKGMVKEIDSKLGSDVVKALSTETLNYQPEKIQESMQKLKDIFENQAEESPDQLIKKLKQSEQELSQLKQKQQDLLQKLRRKPREFDKARNFPDRAYGRALRHLLDGDAKAAREPHDRIVRMSSQTGIDPRWNWTITQKMNRAIRVGFYRDPVELYNALR